MQDNEDIKKIFGQEQVEVLKKIDHKFLTLKTQQAKNKAAVIVMKARVSALQIQVAELEKSNVPNKP